MSVNYHAFTARGLLFTHYEAICEQWYRDFSGYDPSTAPAVLGLIYDEQYAYLTYFDCPFRLCLKNGQLEKQIDGTWSDQVYFNEGMVIYHLLHYTKPEAGVTGVWVPCDTVDGLVSRGRMPDPLLDPFAKRCTGRLAELIAICERLGGKRLNKADAGFEFAAFSYIRLQLIFYDEDEDFPAQAQILVDKGITGFIHFETVGCIISDLLERIEAELS